MKRNLPLMLLLSVVASFASEALSEVVSDAKIKRMLVGSNCYIDNPDAAERMFQNARRRCGGDTNRFARLIYEVAQTNDAWIAEDMIRAFVGFRGSDPNGGVRVVGFGAAGC